MRNLGAVVIFFSPAMKGANLLHIRVIESPDAFCKSAPSDALNRGSTPPSATASCSAAAARGALLAISTNTVIAARLMMTGSSVTVQGNFLKKRKF